MVPAIIAVIVVALLAWYFLDVDVDGGDMPEVSVEGGELPEADVTTGDIDVGTTEETVTTPDVDIDVGTEESDVTVPTIDVSPAPEADEDEAVTQ